jgi:hypothetical protein
MIARSLNKIIITSFLVDFVLILLIGLALQLKFVLSYFFNLWLFF